MNQSYSKTAGTEFAMAKPWVERVGLALLVVTLIGLLNGFTLSSGKSGVGQLTTFYGSIKDIQVTSTAGGSLRTQITWILMGFVGLFLVWHRYYTARKIILRSLPLIVLMTWCGISIFWALDSGIAQRRYARLFIMVIIAIGIASSLDSPKKFLWTLVYVTGAISLVDVIVAFGLPGVGHDWEGNFTGLHSHKNVAGDSAALTILVWLSALRFSSRKGERRLLYFGILLWSIFLVGTKAKTSIGIVVIAPTIVYTAHYVLREFGAKTLSIFLLMLISVSIFISVVILLLGTSFIEVGAQFLPSGDVTLTGRTGLWEFALNEIARHPWLGAGYGSFWNIGDNSPVMQRGSGLMLFYHHAHNGYLETILEIGSVGLFLLFIYLFHLGSLALKMLKSKQIYNENRGISEFFTVFILSVLIYNATGTSFLGTSSIQWFVLILATFWFANNRLAVTSPKV